MVDTTDNFNRQHCLHYVCRLARLNISDCLYLPPNMMATEVKAPSEDDAIVSIVQSCLYPELSVDCGTEAPDCTLNSAFRDQLRERLYRLFNCLRPFGLRPLSLNDRVHLTILYCEQTAKLADFRTDAVDLVKEVTALGQLIDQWLLVDERRELNELVLHWYKERVTVARWRRQVGATHGLARYAVVSSVNPQPTQPKYKTTFGTFRLALYTAVSA